MFSEAVRTTVVPKAIVGLFALSVLAFVAGFIAGLTGGDLRGHLSFGLLVACVLVALAVGMAIRTADSVFRVVRWSWLAMALLVLIVAITFGTHGGDAVLTYAMVALAFPASVPIAPLFGSLLGDATQRIAGLMMLWLTLLATGYVQWFVVCPRVFRSEDPDKATGATP